MAVHGGTKDSAQGTPQNPHMEIDHDRSSYPGIPWAKSQLPDPAVGPCDTKSGFVLDEFTASGKMTSQLHPF